MITFGAHAFVWEPEWTQAAAARVARAAREAGLDLIEVPLLDPERFDPEALRDILKQFDLAASYSLGLPVDCRLPEYPDRAEAFLRRAIDQVARAGGNLLTGVLYGTLGELTGHRPRPDEYDVIARTLRSVARYAAGKGISLGLEPVNRYETYLVNTVEQALRLMEAIGEPNVFLHIDTYHANIEEEGFLKPIRQAGDRLRYLHLSESHRGTPGTGTVAWDEVFRGLKEIGFQGSLVMESFVAVHPDIARATCIWRDVAPSSAVLIREGLSFLREMARRHGLITGR